MFLAAVETRKVNFKRWSDSLTWIALALVACAGIGARWSYIQARVFHVDEFISMLAVQMILEKGVPVLPSGLGYDHGLVFSYIGAVVAWLAGGDLLAVRLWSLMSGVLSIVLVYVLSWQLFGVRWWGLVAAMVMAWFPDAVEWGGRVRMYSQANLVLLIWILLAWWGTQGGGRRWARWSLVIALWIGLNTHFVLILIVPPLGIGLLVVTLVSGNRNTILDDDARHLALVVGAALLVVVSSMWVARGGFVADQTIESSLTRPDLVVAGNGFLNQVLDIGLEGARWAKMGRYLSKVTLFPLSILALWGTLISARRVIVRQFNEADLAGLFIALLLVGVFVEINVFLADAWRVTRYNFLLVFPLLLLMAVYGLRCMSISMTSIAQNTFKRSQPLVYGVMTALAFLWFLSGLWPETVKAMAGEAQAPNQYDLGFEYVDEERAPGDSLLTIRPEAGYLFSDRLDYYANQITPRVTPGSSGWVDAYAGVPYIADVEDLNRALGAQGNLWFVIDIGRLFERFEPAFTQQVLQRMAVMRSFGNVLVLREMEDSWPLAETGRSTLKVTMAGKLQLSGYTLEPLPAMPGETVHITLFWQADARLLQYKVFIHLRDSTGNTVAQADFVPLERMDREWRHRLVGQANSGFIRLGNALVIPSVLSPGEYTIWTGLYDANTLQRLPVTDDASGENAVLLGELTVSGEPAIDQ